MKHVSILTIAILLAAVGIQAAPATKPAVQRQPHMVNLTYYLSDIHEPNDADALVAALKKVKSVAAVSVNTSIGFVQISFDSHAVSYHQIAQAIADAGTTAGKKYDPRLKVRVPDYPIGDNAARVDKILTGKRLLQHVRIETLDKSKGEFVIHFLPLQLETAIAGPQEYNGGHLNHPIHDPPPRGLGLTFTVLGEALTAGK